MRNPCAECPIPRNRHFCVVPLFVRSTLCARMVPHRASAEMPQTALCRSPWCRPSRASARDQVRADEGFRPRMRRRFSRSRRDLAICAVDALNVPGAAQRKHQSVSNRPIQVGGVSLLACGATSGARETKSLEHLLPRMGSSRRDLAIRHGAEAHGVYPENLAKAEQRAR